tara:strand:+ start:7322 stop:8317 length:996 start_codon:yes stop_codon:yes gene_type:complete
MKNSWYTFKNSSNGQPAEVLIYEQIGDWGVTAQNFIKDVQSVGKSDLTVRINSVGGSVFDGLAIYNILRSHKGNVNVKIEGLAASIASIIALGGDNIEMAENGFFMIHNPFGNSFGDAEEMRKTADLLDKIKKELVSVYAKQSSLTESEIQDMMDEETWLTSQEALEMGFVDTITEPIKIAASFDLSRFNNVDSKEVKNKLELLTNNKSNKMTEELKTWFNGVKEEIINAVKGEVVAETPANEEVSVVLSDNEEIVNKLTDLSNEKEELTGIVAEKESIIADFENKVSEMEAELAKYNATETKVEADNDPAINEADVVVNEWDAFAKSLLK